MSTKIFKTPLGWAGVAVSDRGIRRVVLPKKSRQAVQKELESPESRVREKAKRRRVAERLMGDTVRLLERYFSGQSPLFDIPLDFDGYTPFQQSVWKACAHISFGETRSYGWLARRIGKPLAARAVGQAMGANPVPIFVP